jgi:protein SCO1/2
MHTLAHAPEHSPVRLSTHQPAHGPARRRWLQGAGAMLLAGPVAVLGAPRGDDSGHFPFGPLRRPRALAPWPVWTHLGQQTTLQVLLQGKTTALQLMFTGCSATCPLQGALFAQAQRALQPGEAGLQLLSLSIDALGDSPVALARWLAKMGAQAGWLAAVPRVADVDTLIARLGQGGEPRPAGSDPHNGQVYLINRRAELVWRSASLPPAAQVVAALRDTARRFG